MRPEGGSRLPPYVSYSAWKTLLGALANFLPDVVDSSYFRELHFSGSSIKKLRSALLYLGLIDGNQVPTERLQRLTRAIRGASPEGMTAVLRALLVEAYPTLFANDMDLRIATIGQVVERFERLGAKGDVQKQCISFFQHLAAEAGIELSPHLAGRSRLGIGRKSVVLRSRDRRRIGRTPSREPVSASAADLYNIHPALLGLLKTLPIPGSIWNLQDKERFKKALDAMLDFIYPSESK